ncbi:Histone-lysine N-methyltransferase [Halocaridina rubra]|uniref:[histone H4]-lysine(20) N-methyltransferase n=1 Tax=Halocaridina rubra TaxID=373956 RepID=A0AAN8XID6_HALRR
MVNHFQNCHRNILKRPGVRVTMVKGKRRTNRSSKDENALVNHVDGPKGPKDSRLDTKMETVLNNKKSNQTGAVSRKKESKITNYFSPSSKSPPVAYDAESTQGESLTNGTYGMALDVSVGQLGRPISVSAPTTPTDSKTMNGYLAVSSTVTALITPPKRTVFTRSQALKELQLQFPNEPNCVSNSPAKTPSPASNTSSTTSLASPLAVSAASSLDESTSPHAGPLTPHKIQALNEKRLRLDSPLSPASTLAKLKISLTPKKLVFNGKPSKARRKLPTQPTSRIATQPKEEKSVKHHANSTVANGEVRPTHKETQITEFFPIRRSRRKPKTELQLEQQKEIEERILNNCEEGLKVEHFGAKGRGVVTTRHFSKGEFVIEYIGDLIDMREAKDREKIYSQDASKGCYNYYFTFQNQQYCIDATEETGYLGRLVNHSRNGNLVTKAVEVNGRPHLILLAKTDIEPNTEILYDYGDRSKEALQHHPWLAL